MNLVTALALVIGLLGGVLTWLMFGPLAGLSLWAAFIAWGSFFHCGGGESGLQKSLLAAIWGAIMATAALAVLPSLGALGSLAAPVAVGVTVAIMILGAHIPALSAIPAAVYGYASTAAFALLMGDKASVLGTTVISSPLLNIVSSMVIGGIFGYVSEKIAGALAAK